MSKLSREKKQATKAIKTNRKCRKIEKKTPQYIESQLQAKKVGKFKKKKIVNKLKKMRKVDKKNSEKLTKNGEKGEKNRQKQGKRREKSTETGKNDEKN